MAERSTRRRGTTTDRAMSAEARLDRVLVQVDRRTFDRFVALLDGPPRPNARLRALLQTPAPWERQAARQG